MGRGVFSFCDNLIIRLETDKRPAEWNKSWKDYRSTDISFAAVEIWDCNNIDTDENGNIYCVFGNVNYRINKDGIVFARSAYGKYGDKLIIQPEITYDGKVYPVTRLDDDSFNYAAFSEIQLPDSIE